MILVVGLFGELRKANLHIPEDISIISYDNIPQMDNMEIPLTCIGVPVDHTRNRNSQSIIKFIEEKEIQPIVKKMTPTLNERASCAS